MPAAADGLFLLFGEVVDSAAYGCWAEEHERDFPAVGVVPMQRYSCLVSSRAPIKMRAKGAKYKLAK